MYLGTVLQGYLLYLVVKRWVARASEGRDLPVQRLPFSWVVVIASFCLVTLGCSREESARQDGAAVATTSGSVLASVVAESGSSATHDPSHPPIDCPLRKQGIDLARMRPFEEAAKYVEFLERSDRAQWQKPDAVVAALGLGASDIVFDLGAGSGYFSFRLAAAVPAGRVIAADTEAEMIRHIHHRAMAEGVQNIQAKLIKPNAPEVDASADVIFICDVLHHVTDRPAWLKSIAAVMKSGARLALIEFREGRLPEGPPESVKISRAELVTLVTGAGLTLKKEHEKLLPYQVYLEFQKP